jgi:small-conductance mechanosensitive channel
MQPYRVARSPFQHVALALLVGLAVTSGAGAQTPPGDEAGSAPPSPLEAISPEDVAARAADTQRFLRSAEARAEAIPGVERVAERLGEVEDRWREDAEGAVDRLAGEASPMLLAEAERVWSVREELLAEWDATLRRRGAALSENLAQLESQRELWEHTRNARRDEELPAALQETIRRIQGDVEVTRRRVRERRDAVLAIQSSVLEQRRHVEDVLEVVDQGQEQVRSRLVVRDSLPLWSALAQARTAEMKQGILSAWKDSIDALDRYASEHADDLAAFAFLLVALVAAIAWLRRHAVRSAREDEAFTNIARVLGRPVSAALVMLLVAYPLFFPAAPLLLRWITGVAILIPALRLISPLLEGSARSAFYLLSAWFAVDMLRLLLASAPVLSRALLLLEAAAVLTFLVRLRRPSRLAALRAGVGRIRVLAVAARIAPVLLTVSLLSNLLGNTSLAEVLVEGTLRGAYVAVLLQGGALVLQDLLAVLLHTRALHMLRGVQHHEPLLRQRGSTLISWGLAFLWVWLTLGFFQLAEPIRNGIVAVLTATWPIGDLEFSLGDLVVFGLTVWLVLWLSRFVRFVLDEDVLPRADLPRGVPYAISSGTHYVILLLGFLLAVAAAGFDMNRFVLIIGALGVGIGIGLQDVVNNFVSGLILLFERPVQTGDTVQVGEIFGEIRRIGMRSSTVRTWSGAEVIVPNSKLVSDNLTNWTLSDSLRRLEIPIGVAYGTDPERVIALLLDVARGHQSVLAEPAPSALFQAHGNSSLDFELRAWTASPEWIVVKSDLTVAINRALHEAGIKIPFPQHDLHLRSMDPEVRDALHRSPAD